MNGEALRAILECVDEGVVGVDGEGRVIFASATAERMLGPAPLGDTLLRAQDVAQPNGAPFVVDRLPLVRAMRGERSDRVELVVRNARPRGLRLEMSGRPLPDGGGVVVFAEPRARPSTEAELGRTKVFLDSIIENIPSMVFVKDAEQLRFELVNRATEELLGLPRAELLGKTDYDFFPAEQAAFFQERDRKTLESGSIIDVPEEPIRTEHGERWLHTTKISINGSDGKPRYLLGISQDITARKRAEEALRKAHDELEARVAERTEALKRSEEKLLASQKMEAIGRLAGGIAHDFNNMLTVILTQSTLLVRRATLDERTRHPIAQITQAANRAATLTRQLLAFSRQQVMLPRPTDLGAVVRDLEQMVRRLIGEDIDLQTSTDHRLDLVDADPGQMEQVILNLAANARDAMPRGGRLVIRTSNVELSPSETTDMLKPGPHVLLLVSDSGVGMDEETQSRVFEPFFTTKDRGQGTGLGLSTVYGIVRQTGGDLQVSSSPGRGTTFHIYFPRSATDVVPAKHPSGQYAIGGTETVLLVEDEPLVREATRTVLSSAGFEVLVAADGAEALRICEERDVIHVLVTDVVMPGMSGPELAERVKRVRPSLRVVFVSGYTDHPIVRGDTVDSVEFLNKPFLPDALVRKVREVLER